MLKRMHVEELMNVEVYSASRFIEPVQESPNAIFVLAGEDLRRAHVTSIPEALRLVPGVQVGRVDANKWAVSMRGFNSREANKLLVLLDGRSIYDPLFSGTLWESQDVVLEDVERIEVIRGPGGTLWGANAFNGIINIITKGAANTQGGLLALSGGDEENYTAVARYGWQAGEQQHARVYFKAWNHDTGYAEMVPAYDAADSVRGGFRWDLGNGEGSQLRISGDAYRAETGIREDPGLVQDVIHKGRNVMLRWNQPLAAGSALQVQLYYDHVDFESLGFDQHRNHYDLELQHSLQPGTRHFVIWGGGARLMRDRTRSQAGLSGLVDVLPASRDDEVINVFAQDTISLVPGRLGLVLGLKYESTDYASAEWLPNVRVTFTPTPQQTWWMGASEATRVPSRLESDLTFFSTLRPGDTFGAEHVRAYELGHRMLVVPSFGYDVTLFYHDYDNLLTSEAGGTEFRNLMHGNSYGAEVALRWEPTGNWRLDTAYTWLEMDLGLDAASTTSPNRLRFLERLTPRHQVSLHSLLDISARMELDLTLRRVGALPSLDVPAYTELDAGITWKATPQLDFSVVGRNLLHAHHPEQGFASSASGMPSETERSLHARLAWHH
jgi:iron complex outermembrane receptor protein